MYASKLPLLGLVGMLLLPVHGQIPPSVSPKKSLELQLNLQAVGLTTDQATQIKTMQDQDKSHIQDIRDQILRAQRDFHRSLVGESDSQVRQRFERMQQLQYDLGQLRTENILRIRALLTTQQRQQLRQQYMANSVSSGAFTQDMPSASFNKVTVSSSVSSSGIPLGNITAIFK